MYLYGVFYNAQEKNCIKQLKQYVDEFFFSFLSISLMISEFCLLLLLKPQRDLNFVCSHVHLTRCLQNINLGIFTSGADGGLAPFWK